MMALRMIIFYLFMIAGSTFGVITVIGLIRFPDVYTRIHAGAVVLTISAVLITSGMAIYVWDFYLSLKLLLISVFFLISNPMATHAIARASYQRRIACPRERSIDDYSNYLGEERGC